MSAMDTGGSDPATAQIVFPRTKFLPPATRPDVVERRTLVDALAASIESHPVMLVSAPAGYGKSSLVAAVARSRPAWTTAWLTLDRSDDDPVAFLGALAASVAHADPRCASASKVLRSLPDATTGSVSVIGALVNDVIELHTDPFVVVLDDAEVVSDAEVAALLDMLVDHLPEHLHIVLVSRRDPPLSLARLRANGRLTEVRLGDLRLQRSEIDSFLNGRLGMGLDADTLDLLDEQTEGWAAGLRLLAGSLERIDDAAGRARFVRALVADDRFAAEYLAEEVLDRQPSDIRSFLLRCAVLREELTPERCAIIADVKGTSDLLDEVARRNLFVSAIDETARTFRMHGLFAQFLRTVLEREDPDLLADLHRRAAAIELDVRPERAVEHLLAAGDVVRAAKVAGPVVLGLVREGRAVAGQRLLDLLPAHTVAADDRLSLAAGIAAVSRSEFEPAQDLLETARSGFEASGDREGLGMALNQLAAIAVYQHDSHRSGELIEAALDCPLPPTERTRLLLRRSLLAQLTRRREAAASDLDAALTLAESTAGPEVIYDLLQAHPTLAYVPGGLDRLERICRVTTDRLGSPLPPGLVRVFHDGQLALTRVLRGRPEEAPELVEDGLGQLRQLGLEQTMAITYLMLPAMFGYTFASDDDAVARWLSLLFTACGAAGVGRADFASGLFFEGRSLLRRNDVVAAARVHEEMARSQAPKLPGSDVLTAIVGALVAEAQQDLASAERQLTDAVQMGEEEWRGAASFCDVRLVQAHLYALWRRPKKALAALEVVLDEGARRDMPGIVLREGGLVVPPLRLAVDAGLRPELSRPMLDALVGPSTSRPVTVPDSGETLTVRELEVLQLLAEGAANQDIADRLVISIHTVKRHVANLLMKLGVSSRTQAAARARELHLLG